MREGWKEVSLREILEIKHGYGFKGEYFVEEETKNVLVTPGNFNIGGGFKNDKLKFYNGPINDNFVLKENDVVVTMTDLSKMADTIGYSAKIPKSTDKIYLHNQRIGLVKLLDDSFDLNFIYWLLRTNDYQRYIAGSAIGATVKHTSPSKIYTAKVKIPTDKDAQRKIANILSGYDDLIENNQKRIKILEEMAQQTYEEWFVRMRFPGYETAIFDENGLPEDWEEVKIQDLCAVSGGGTPSKANDEFWDNGKINWFTPTDLSKNKSLVISESELKTNELGIVKSSAKVLQPDSFIMTSRATIGLFALLDKPFSTNQGFINTTPNNSNLKAYLLYNFKSRIDQLMGLATGATFPELSKSKFKVLKINRPSDIVLSAFEDFTKKIFSQLFNLSNQNQRLREARDILLPRLMMGMIDVSESSVKVENVEAKPTDAKVIPLEQPKKEASKEFKEAILIACLTERFGSEKFPLGRKRYTKLSYLFHRYSDNKIQHYLRKAAGPYNPKTKYGGPEKIALQNKYIQNWQGENGTTGFLAAEKIDDAKKYFSNYWQIEDLDWLTKEFKFKSNDELELFATVDNSLVELSKKNLEFTSANVLDIIKSEKEWEAKLDRKIFDNENVNRAIGILRGVLGYSC